jgi:lipopolysaccharide export system permease protein
VIDEFKADPGISFLQAGRFMELDKGAWWPTSRI